jgi:hypothetical protein
MLNEVRQKEKYFMISLVLHLLKMGSILGTESLGKHMTNTLQYNIIMATMSQGNRNSAASL